MVAPLLSNNRLAGRWCRPTGYVIEKTWTLPGQSQRGEGAANGRVETEAIVPQCADTVQGGNGTGGFAASVMGEVWGVGCKVARPLLI
jgi:hypothetical protein